MKNLFKLTAVMFVIITLTALFARIEMEQELNTIVKAVFHKVIPWISITINA